MHKMLRQFSEVVRFEQTLFAVPFAFAGMLLAKHSVPAITTWIWVALAMFGARTAGMAANRLIDKNIDALNPRTQDRAYPAGRISRATLLTWMTASAGLLALASKMLNPLCFALCPLAVFLLMFYSYTKRFTWACHLVLGLVQACAPIGGWLAVAGHFALTPLLMGLAIFAWVAGFDVVYACQDYEHDIAHGVFSVPARFGKERAFTIARSLHALTLTLLLSVGFLTGMGIVYFSALAMVTTLLIWQHQILSPNDLSRLQQAFFNANASISVALFGGILFEVVKN